MNTHQTLECMHSAYPLAVLAFYFIIITFDLKTNRRCKTFRNENWMLIAHRPMSMRLYTVSMAATQFTLHSSMFSFSLFVTFGIIYFASHLQTGASCTWFHYFVRPTSVLCDATPTKRYKAFHWKDGKLCFCYPPRILRIWHLARRIITSVGAQINAETNARIYQQEQDRNRERQRYAVLT